MTLVGLTLVPILLDRGDCILGGHLSVNGQPNPLCVGVQRDGGAGAFSTPSVHGYKTPIASVLVGRASQRYDRRVGAIPDLRKLQRLGVHICIGVLGPLIHTLHSSRRPREGVEDSFVRSLFATRRG